MSGESGSSRRAGGLARAAKLTAERRREIARRAAEARWGAVLAGGGTIKRPSKKRAPELPSTTPEPQVFEDGW